MIKTDDVLLLCKKYNINTTPKFFIETNTVIINYGLDEWYIIYEPEFAGYKKYLLRHANKFHSGGEIHTQRRVAKLEYCLETIVQHKTSKTINTSRIDKLFSQIHNSNNKRQVVHSI
jgi:hypothetical protein